MHKQIGQLIPGEQYFIVIKDQHFDRNHLENGTLGTFVAIRGVDGKAHFTVDGAPQFWADDERDFYEELRVNMQDIQRNLFGARAQGEGPPAGAPENTEMNAWNAMANGNMPRQGPRGPSGVPAGSPGRGGSRTRKQRRLRKQKKDRKTRQRRQRKTRTN